jgi:hypothetical protein
MIKRNLNTKPLNGSALKISLPVSICCYFGCKALTRLIKSIIFLLLFVETASAWNGTGHSTSGVITYYYLKNNNPVVLERVIRALQKHPWYKSREWGNKLAELVGEEKQIALFMLASTFPDDARSIPSLGGEEKKKWHYIDYCFATVQTSNLVEPDHPNAEEKINELLSTIPSNFNPEQKAMDLCWLFHLIQDIHQPLHTVSLFDKFHLNGDRGGNETFIEFPAPASPVKLHAFWDGLIKGNISDVPSYSLYLLRNARFNAKTMEELKTSPTVHDWIYNESFQLAKKDVYRNGTINGTREKPTLVDKDYAAKSSIIAERRIILSGIRIAQLLVQLFK